MRIEIIARDMLPGICHDYKEGVWDFEEAQLKLSHYREVGIGLAQRFDDNVDSLALLEKAYGISADCLEAIQERKEIEKMEREALL